MPWKTAFFTRVNPNSQYVTQYLTITRVEPDEYAVIRNNREFIPRTVLQRLLNGQNPGVRGIHFRTLAQIQRDLPRIRRNYIQNPPVPRTQNRRARRN